MPRLVVVPRLAQLDGLLLLPIDGVDGPTVIVLPRSLRERRRITPDARVPRADEQKGAGVKIFTGGGTSVCIVDLSLDDPVESDAATGSVPRALLVLLLPGLLALGLL